jgi:hypothetical protein
VSASIVGYCNKCRTGLQADDVARFSADQRLYGICCYQTPHAAYDMPPSLLIALSSLLDSLESWFDIPFRAPPAMPPSTARTSSPQAPEPPPPTQPTQPSSVAETSGVSDADILAEGYPEVYPEWD